MKIIFRVDSSPQIGLGHLMRCLVLAKQYQNSQIFFASFEIDEKIIQKNNHKTIKLQTKSIDEFILHVKKIEPHLVIIDSYGIYFEDEKKIKKNTACKLMVLDDTYEKHYADILLNHNVYAQEKLYKDKVPPFCELRCGSKYTLIRDKFIEEKNKKRTKDGIFIAIGGVDAQNLSLKIAQKIPKNIKVKIATTCHNQNLQKLEQYAIKHENISLHVNTTQMAKLMNSSKFAIISPSVIAHEALYLDLPFLAIKTAQNQFYMYEYLKKQDILCIKNIDNLDIKEALKHL